MRALKLIIFVFLISLSLIAGSVRAENARVFLPEDELILPPLLNDISSIGDDEDRVNVVELDGHKYQAKSGEWLDFGDSLDLIGRLAFQVIQRESIQWVGGGLFSGKIGSGRTVKDDGIYIVTVSHGWMKIWIKPDTNHSTLHLFTPSGSFLAKEGIYWVEVRPEKTEIYVFQGTLMVDSTQAPLLAKSYSVFQKGTPKPLYISRDWDPGAIEVRIASAFPQVVKLATIAQKQWDEKEVEETYARYRKKGWRKASRLDPKVK